MLTIIIVLHMFPYLFCFFHCILYTNLCSLSYPQQETTQLIFKCLYVLLLCCLHPAHNTHRVTKYKHNFQCTCVGLFNY